MEIIQKDLLLFALDKVSDGWRFEEFAQGILSVVAGIDFSSLGGIHDGGIDGIEHMFHQSSHTKIVYQFSIEKNVKQKIRKTCMALGKGKRKYDLLTYVSNHVVADQDRVSSEIYSEFKSNVVIKDAQWLADQINTYPAARKFYESHVENNLHAYQQPGKSVVYADLVQDPSVYSFLRQQIETNKNAEVENSLYDTLIQYALKDTDPVESIFMTRSEIRKGIIDIVGDESAPHPDVLQKRLDTLSGKPRKINVHPGNNYCLPYKTRNVIAISNIEDERLSNFFWDCASQKLKKHLDDKSVNIRKVKDLLNRVIQKIFYDQGSVFAEFMASGNEAEALDIDLVDIVSEVVNEHYTIVDNTNIKDALIRTIRDIVYHGSDEEKQYLQKLSKTYTLFFCVKCNPKVALFFKSVAEDLCVFVCTSIIIPILSEYFLEDRNRRYWGLITSARASGVNLVVNDIILEEAVSHILRAVRNFDRYYSSCIEDYQDDIDLVTIPEILIRSFFYARNRKQINNFREFINKFISIDGQDSTDEFREFLLGEFDIKYISNSEFPDARNDSGYKLLYEELVRTKPSEQQAMNDAQLILGIYRLRDREGQGTGIKGYKHWWLSTDTKTHTAVRKAFGSKYGISCAMPPDFLHRYISLVPSPKGVRKKFDETFSGLLGVNLSNLIPLDVQRQVRKFRKDHSDISPGRRRALIRKYMNELKSDPGKADKEYVTSYFSDDGQWQKDIEEISE